jgi:phosphatidylinositol N-acetylglucosaminyltransferase subunit A
LNLIPLSKIRPTTINNDKETASGSPFGIKVEMVDERCALITASEKPAISQKRHRVAMVCDFFYPNLGGVENHIWSLAQHLVQLGHKVIVVTHAYGNRKGVRYLPGPLKVYYCPIVPMTANVVLPTFTATLPLLRWIFLREGIEIVHAHQATSTIGNESVVYAAMMGLASVYTDHSLFGFDDLASVILNRVLQTTLSTVDAAICVSHTCRDNFILRTRMASRSASHSNIPLSRRVRVIPNAVSTSKFKPCASAHNENDRCAIGVDVDLLMLIASNVGSGLVRWHSPSG